MAEKIALKNGYCPLATLNEGKQSHLESTSCMPTFFDFLRHLFIVLGKVKSQHSALQTIVYPQTISKERSNGNNLLNKPTVPRASTENTFENYKQKQ